MDPNDVFSLIDENIIQNETDEADKEAAEAEAEGPEVPPTAVTGNGTHAAPAPVPDPLSFSVDFIQQFQNILHNIPGNESMPIHFISAFFSFSPLFQLNHYHRLIHGERQPMSGTEKKGGETRPRLSLVPCHGAPQPHSPTPVLIGL